MRPRAVAWLALACGMASGAWADCPAPAPLRHSPAVAVAQGDIRTAAYSEPVSRYAHGILGDAVEAGTLVAGGPGGCVSLRLPDHSVFEDTAPRIADLDGDGRNEIVVVETRADLGAALAIYGLRDGRLVKLAATPNIGRTHRWLAPAGIADLDGDGRPEIAFVDRPHLARILRVWRYGGGRLTEIAAASGLTNHRIGDTVISGGMRVCGGTAEIVVATPDWRRRMAVRLTDGGLVARDIGAGPGGGVFGAEC